MALLATYAELTVMHVVVAVTRNAGAPHKGGILALEVLVQVRPDRPARAGVGDDLAHPEGAEARRALRPRLEASGLRLEVPLSVSRKASLLSGGVATLLLSLLEALTAPSPAANKLLPCFRMVCASAKLTTRSLPRIESALPAPYSASQV